MVGWHHRLNGHEFEETLGDGEGQENLACCNPWGHGVAVSKELDTAQLLNNSNNTSLGLFSPLFSTRENPLEVKFSVVNLS